MGRVPADLDLSARGTSRERLPRAPGARRPDSVGLRSAGSDGGCVRSDPAAYGGLDLGLLGRVGGEPPQPLGDADVPGLGMVCGEFPGGLLAVPEALDGE